MTVPYNFTNKKMKKIFIAFVATLVVASSFAQTQDEQKLSPWKIGVTMGGTINTYHMNNSYQSDWSEHCRGGFEAGVSGQYNFTKWFGVRADLMWMQKNYRRSRTMITNSYKYTNNYLQLPVMANFSFGGCKLRGFVNLGVYGGYWMSSSADVCATNVIADRTDEISQSGLINSERDNRFVFGYVGGAGVEYRFMPHWSAQVEFRYYYDATSQVKQYQRISDHRYNSTMAIQAGVFYNF